jgi:hypothetical protein
MTKDKVVVGLVSGTLEVALQLTCHAISEGHCPEAPARLGRHELPADIAATDPDLSGGPIHVPPTQRQQFALAQTRHRRRQVESRLDRAEDVIGNREEDGFDLLDGQEADLVMPIVLRPRHPLHRVLPRPSLLDGEVEKGVQDAQVVANRLRCSALAPL